MLGGVFPFNVESALMKGTVSIERLKWERALGREENYLIRKQYNAYFRLCVNQCQTVSATPVSFQNDGLSVCH